MTPPGALETEWFAERLLDGDLRTWVEELLLGLCAVDTTLVEDVGRLRRAEEECFDLVAQACRDCLPEDATVSRLPISPAIARQRHYTVPRYAGSLQDDPAAVYEDRHNLLLVLDGQHGQPTWLLNAHIDTVPPHIAPSRSIGLVAGRGAVDDKGGVVTALLAARLIGEWSRRVGRPLPSVHILVSIDEEMGGNGTLAALEDLSLADTRILVLEPTDLQPFPANRGAIWFTVDIQGPPELLGTAFCEVVLELAQGADEERASFSHPLFVPEDVSFCLGILNAYGVHPASACESVELSWKVDPAFIDVDSFARKIQRRLKVDAAIAHRSPDPDVRLEGDRLQVRVSSIPGHMGSRSRDSDAIVKAAAIVQVGEDIGLGPVDWAAPSVRLEGGQGFLPGRSIDDVEARLTKAFEAGLARVRPLNGSDELGGSIRFDRLRNEAYASAPDSPTAPLLAKCIEVLTGRKTAALSGWQASCDARLFAIQCDDVVTFGPGRLEVAHGPGEAIATDQVMLAAGAIALALCS